jgi:DNA ligase 1
MNTVNLVRALAATNSRTEKEQLLLDAWMNGERTFFQGAQLAYDILVSFGVKKVPEVVDFTPEEEADPGLVTWSDFEALAHNLATRKLTGGAAKTAIADYAERCNPVMWNEFYRRVLLKDLRCGTTDTTVNKILEKLAKSDQDAKSLIVPVFSCQLAKDGADPANAKKICGTKQLDIKLDGVRLLTIVDREAGTVTQYTRNGKQNDNFPHIRAAFEPLLADDSLLPVSMVFDGEITSKSFQTLMTQVNRTAKIDTSETKLALFDIIPLADFKAGKCKMTQKDRHTALCGVIGMMLHLSGEAYVVPKLTVNLDTPEGQRTFTEFNREAIEAGYEGIMVKDPEAPYETKRAFHWLKVKPFIEVSLTIVGYEEGTGKNVGKLGAWIMEGTDDGKQIKCNVGGGFSDKEREDFWKAREDMIGFIGEVRADCFSLEQGETVYALRFPRWKGVRGTERGEKL